MDANPTEVQTPQSTPGGSGVEPELLVTPQRKCMFQSGLEHRGGELGTNASEAFLRDRTLHVDSHLPPLFFPYLCIRSQTTPSSFQLAGDIKSRVHVSSFRTG